MTPGGLGLPNPEGQREGNKTRELCPLFSTIKGGILFMKNTAKISKGQYRELNQDTHPPPNPQGQGRPLTEGHLPTGTKGSGLSLENLGPTLERGSP